jgi:hypothetical protein
MTPNNYVADQGAFNTAYPSDESAPRTEYCIFVLNDSATPGTGPGNIRSFADATFVWTKNEVIQRFDFEAQDGRFKALPGSVLEVVGTMTADANTTRLKVTAPLTSLLSSYPVRVSIGTGSGTTLTSAVVVNDGAFTTPPVGTVQISQATGNLNWNPADITTYGSQSVRFQRQTFYTFDESSGNLGIIDDPLLLNPLPATGQYPLVRIGFGQYLTPVQRATETAFSSNPATGTVEWALNTGRLKFNTGDVTANTSRNVYYDGSAFAFEVRISTFTLGTVNAPGILSPLPPEASDLFFRISGVVQFAQTTFVDTLTSPGKKGTVQIRRSDGQVQFSASDQQLYSGQIVQAVVPDIAIERGMVIRMFRTPVNLDDTDATLKDVSCFYVSNGAILADPIIGSPTVTLPAIPVDTQPLVVEVTQGTGTFTGVLPRLDVASPPTGLGYIIDFEARNLLYAQRKSGEVIAAPTPYGGVQLPDPMVFGPGLILEVETTAGGGVYAPLTLGEDALIDKESGLVTLVDTDGSLIVEGSGGSFAGTSFTDTSKDFTTLGVQPGDYLVVLSGAAKGVYGADTVGTSTLTTDVAGSTSSNLAYEIRRGVEILVDRFFYEVPPVDPNTRVERLLPLGMTTNSPRLTIDATKASSSRFRFGDDTFSTHTVLVANDGSFTSPGTLPQGTVQVSQATGNLNFSSADITGGSIVFWSKALTLGIDYQLQPPLGFVQFSDRMLTNEEAFITYKDVDGNLLQERATFLIRKELVQPHPAPTSTLYYNPAGHEVASLPTPRAYRGGRPQSTNQVLFTPADSSVTFIETPTVTDALPSGPTVDPIENVYVDYSIYNAIGGEQSFTVLNPPMQGVAFAITEGDNSFRIAGDRTDVLAANILLLVDRTEAYLIGSSSYDSSAQVTTVVLMSPQTFRSDFTNPTLAVSSGKIRVTGSVINPSYFVTEMAAYDPVPRGSSKFLLAGDHSRTYTAGTVVIFGSLDMNVVSGSKYSKDSGKTEVTLLANCLTQYSGISLKRSVRPVLPSPSAAASTQRSPELGQPYTVFRRTEGQVGTVLQQPDQYTIDSSGSVVLANPLTFNEEVGIFYTGDTIIEAGRRFRASYTFAIVPNDQNGLNKQTLKISYTTYAPDSFYWRVETFTNFRGELIEAYTKAAKSSVPTGGPTLENSSSPRLSDQGKESLYFEEGYLANEDLVARPTLKYFNDAINYLEDALEGLDGRVVGDHDGRFLFDGNIDNPPRTTFATVTNQIDDRFQISPAPFTITGPPFVATSIGTFVEVYKTSPTSRFYPTRTASFGVVVAGTKTGDPIMDTGVKNLRGVSGIQRRFPWCVTTAFTPAGSTTLQVDDSDGSTDLLRPPFAASMKIAVIAQNGTVLVPDGFSGAVLTASGTSLTLSAGIPVDIPVGSTVRLSTTDTSYYKQYRLGLDVNVDLERGLLLYVDPVESASAWAGLTLLPQPPAAGEILDIVLSTNNTSTEPFRFPALDGSTTDDDGNRQFPVLTPFATSETSAAGYLTVEQSIIATGTGTIRLATSAPFVGTGNLDGSGTVITNTGGAWPSPIPKIHDLVEIRSGSNAGTSFRRITAVGGSTITLNTAYTVDSGFTFAVTTNTSLRIGTAGSGSSTSTLVDLSANFISANVRPGHTVVMLSGADVGLRRQVVSVVSATQLQLSPYPSTILGGSYRIDNPLQTFGFTPASIGSQLASAIAGELTVLGDHSTAIDNFFNTIFVDEATGTNGVASASTFTSAGQTFLTSGINTSYLLFIRNGVDAGFYKIQSVDSQTNLTIEGSFPVNSTGIVFRIVSSIGLTVGPLNGVLDAAQSSALFATATTAFQAIVSTPVVVSGDAGAYATRLVTSDLDARATAVSGRFTQVGTDVTSLESELSAGDRLYDKRFVWIDARINLEKGILVMKDRAVASRIKAQKDVLKQLTKLLSVQT